MSRTSRRLTATAAIVALAGFPASALACDSGTLARSSGPLRDFQPAAAGPFDGATATVKITATRYGSRTVLKVKGVGAAAEGVTFGAHLHAGPCVAGNGAAAGPHYNTDLIAGVPPAEAEVSEDTEVWLDFEVEDGKGRARAEVPFVPVGGQRSVVVHAMATDPSTGLAGGRLACLPVEW